jgi:HSP20 family protein
MLSVRSSLYRLATTSSKNSPKIALAVVKPAAVVLSGTISRLWFSTNPKRRDDELFHKTYSDAFDESDSLEVGKKEATHHQHAETKPKAVKIGGDRTMEERRATRYNGPIFRPLFSGFDEFFARDPFFARHEPFIDIMPGVLRNFPVNPRMTLLRSSPGYEIKENDGTYEISIDLPDGVQASDMTVELENDGTVLHLVGRQKVEEKNMVSETRFDKWFTIGQNVDTRKISANLDNGVLVLRAPKLEKETLQKLKQTITITENPHIMTDEEVVQKNYSDEFDESDWAEAGKKKDLQ